MALRSIQRRVDHVTAGPSLFQNDHASGGFSTFWRLSSSAFTCGDTPDRSAVRLHCTHTSAYGRLIPSALMRDASVVGFMPSNAAAPSAPKIFPLVNPSAWTILSRSWRLNSSLVAGLGDSGVLPRQINQGNSGT